MNKFKDISTGAIIILVILLILEVYYFYEKTTHEYTLDELDKNKDGVVTKQELKYHMMNVMGSKKSISKKEILKLAGAGVIRGLMMGFLLADLEGGVVLGITLGILNPLISGAQKIFV